MRRANKIANVVHMLILGALSVPRKPPTQQRSSSLVKTHVNRVNRAIPGREPLYFVNVNRGEP